MRKTVMLGILMLLALLAMPMASAHVTMYLDPQDSSVPNGYGNTTYVRVMANITSPDDLLGTQFAIYHDQSCANITDLQWGPSIFTTLSSWNAGTICPGYNYDWVMCMFTSPQTGVVEICNLTIYCNCSTCGYCVSPLNFSCGISGCAPYCPIQILNGSNVNLHLISGMTTLENGTVTCGTQLADIVPNRIDSKYIFADLNNSLFAEVTNQGGVASGPFDVCVDVTDDFGASLYNNTERFDSLAPGESTCTSCADCKSKAFLGWWTPDTVENITITVTVDCGSSGAGEVDEGTAGESNNVLVDVRNTTNDCSVDTMLPDTCYGYRGDNPMTTAYEGTGGVIYSVGDFKYKNNTVNFSIGASGDDNQVDGLTADIPAGATVKNATLYVYYCYRKSVTGPNPGTDPRPDYNMSIDGGNITTDEYYTDIKGFTTSETQYGTLVYDVTANVTGNGNYQAKRLNCNNTDPVLKGKGYVSGMALMIIYACEDPCDEYRIAHGYDRLATLYYYSGSYRPKRMEYYVDRANATTTATLTDIDPDATAEANLFTVTVDAVPPSGESEQFNARPWDVGAWDCIIPGCNYYHPLGINRGAVDVSDLTPSGTDETVNFREEWTCASNGFAPLFMCLTTREKKKSVHTALGADKQCDVNFGVDKGCIEDLTALNVSDASPAIPDDPSLDHGLFALNITCLEPGETVNVTIELSSPSGGYMKYNTTLGNWDDKVPCIINGNTIVVTLTDGGHYDLDNAADGQITDPGGALSAGVDVSIDPCPVDIYVGIPKTVNISLSNIKDYGSGTIHLYYDKDMIRATSVGIGDSNFATTNPPPTHFPDTSGHVEISAHSNAGLDGTVAFVNVTFVTAPGATSGCTYLNLTVETLYDRNYTALDTVVNNCTDVCIVERNIPIPSLHVETPYKILTDTGRARVQYINCTNITNLTVKVQDDTLVAAVYVNLTPILGGNGVNDEVPMNGTPSIDGLWYLETNASISSPMLGEWNPDPYELKVMAVDCHGNWNNGSEFELTTLKRGDVSSLANPFPTGNSRTPDDKVDMQDYYFIARYSVGLEPLVPDIMDTTDRRCRGEIVGLNGAADSWNGIDMADALYIALSTMPNYPAP